MVDMIKLIINILDEGMIKLVVSMLDTGMSIRRIIIMMEMNMIKLIINVLNVDVIIGMMISMVDMGVVKWIFKNVGSIDDIGSNQTQHGSASYMDCLHDVNDSGEIIRTTLTNSSQSQTNSLEGVL